MPAGCLSPSLPNVHQRCETLQPFNARSQLVGLFVGDPQLWPSCPIVHQQSVSPLPSMAMHVCYVHSIRKALGGARDLAGSCQFCLQLYDQPMKGTRCHPPLRLKTASKQPSEQQDVLIPFPCLKKSSFWERGKEGTGEGKGRDSIWESVPWQEWEKTITSRYLRAVTMLKPERKQENSISVILFFFTSLRAPRGWKRSLHKT